MDKVPAVRDCLSGTGDRISSKVTASASAPSDLNSEGGHKRALTLPQGVATQPPGESYLY